MSLILSGTDGLSDVDGSAATPAIRGTDANTGIFFPAADTIAFAEGGVESMRLDSSGNLGLGVTPSAWGVSGVLQTQNSGSYLFGGGTSWSGGNFMYLGNNGYYNGTNWIYSRTNAVSQYVQVNGEHRWQYAASGTAGNAITFTQAMTLDASGNLAVGTTSPLARLHGEGTGTQLRLTYSGVASYNFKVLSPNAFTIDQDGTERLRIDSSGNLLVGTTSQINAEKFGVSANVANYMAIFKNSGNNANRLGIAIQCGANDASGTNYAMAFDDGDGTRQGQITFSGGTTTYGTSSDYRLKENISPLTGSLNRLALLKPCKWNWKRDGGEAEGFVAHELQDIVPIAVAGEKDAVDEEGNPVYQSVGAANIVPLLVSAIQELKAEFDAYKASHP